MIILSFNKSRSKSYPEALRKARFFDNVDLSAINRVTISVKEIFEKWEHFNALFWLIVDWSGTYIETDGMKYYSHGDKTRIFYALQQSHYNWVNYASYKLMNLDRVYTGRNRLVEIEGEYLTDYQVNCMIDEMKIKKIRE